MFRRALLAVLVAALLVPALPVLADDDGWALPDVGSWVLGLFDLDWVTIEVAMSEEGGTAESPDQGTGDTGSEPDQENGMFIDPSG